METDTFLSSLGIRKPLHNTISKVRPPKHNCKMQMRKNNATDCSAKRGQEKKHRTSNEAPLSRDDILLEPRQQLGTYAIANPKLQLFIFSNNSASFYLYLKAFPLISVPINGHSIISSTMAIFGLYVNRLIFLFAIKGNLEPLPRSGLPLCQTSSNLVQCSGFKPKPLKCNRQSYLHI